MTPAQKSALKHAANQWAEMNASVAVKRTEGRWIAMKKAKIGRDAAKQKFIDLLNEVEVTE